MDINISNSFTLEEYWQNFNLGTEIDIAGAFIYNGIDAFDKMKNFNNPSESFEVLYNLSVGIERLQKVVIILSTYSKEKYQKEFNQSNFEKNLISHSHNDLMARIKKIHNIKFCKNHNIFLNMLTNFYKSFRYDRYSIKSISKSDKEKNILIEFFIRNLYNLKLDETMGVYLENSNRLRIFFSKTIKFIISQLFELVRNEAHRLNIYTYELKYDSKAARVFWGEELNFIKDRAYKTEILLYLSLIISQKSLAELEPLKFGMFNEDIYLKALFNISEFMQLSGEIETFYEDNLNPKEQKERKELMNNIEYIICSV